MTCRMLAVACVLSASIALGQEAAVETAPAPEAPPAAPAAEESPLKNLRMRSGFSIVGGPNVPLTGGGGIGGLGGAIGRVGVQVNDLFSLYYQPTAVVGMQVQAGGGTASASIFVGVFNTILAGLTLNHMLDFGLGIGQDLVVGESGGGGGGTATASIVVATAWGAHARVALLLGGPKNGGPKRSAFSIALDLHPTFLSGRTLFVGTLGLGGEFY